MLNPQAVIDIGSNSVRLVLFMGSPPSQRRVINHKENCALAEGLTCSGKLSQRGRKLAEAAIEKHLELLSKQQIETLHVLATSAIRDASDGKDFVFALKEKFGIEPMILSGDQEARLSALGVLSGVRNPRGLVADLGGGSLELAEATDGEIGKCVSIPLGHIRIAPLLSVGRNHLQRHILCALQKVTWLKKINRGKLYLTGGACRKMGRAHLSEDNQRHHSSDYSVEREDALELTQRLLQSDKTPGSVTVAASILSNLLSITQTDGVVFSNRGLCDGCIVQEYAPVDA